MKRPMEFLRILSEILIVFLMLIWNEDISFTAQVVLMLFSIVFVGAVEALAYQTRRHFRR